jgi:hypothetical protein
MNKEELEMETEKEIRKHRANIKRHRKAILNHLQTLSQEVQAITMHLTSYQKLTRADYPHRLRKLFQVKTVNESQEEAKAYKYITSRKTLDRVFLQELGIIPKPPAPTPKKQIHHDSPMMKMGKLTGEIVSMRGEGFGEQEREILREMLKQLERTINYE